MTDNAVLIHDVLAIVMPIVVGFLTVPITDTIKHTMAFIDKQPPAVKQGLTAGVAGAITLGARLLETKLPVELHLWDASTADALVSALFAMGIKHSTKIKTVAADATVARQTAEMRVRPDV